jgi:uncharacterized protein YndB with AHSA1/START domain
VEGGATQHDEVGSVFAALADPTRWGIVSRLAQSDATVLDLAAPFDMVAPDGQRFSNRVTLLEITPPSRLVIDHGQDVDDDSNLFLVTVAFDEQQDGKTVLTMRQLHPSGDARAARFAFGAVELWYQTLGKLDAYPDPSQI